VALDQGATVGRVSPDGNRVDVWVIAANEEAVIARQTTGLVGQGAL